MPIMVSTTFEIDGYNIVEQKGIAWGIIVRTPTIAQGIVGSLKSIVGGKVGAYKKMCEQTREEAFELLLNHAEQKGANAIVGMRFDTSDLGAGATEVLCYGTAVVVKRGQSVGC